METTQTLIAALNSYDVSTEDANIWQDIILSSDLYDPALTDSVDKGNNDRFGLTTGEIVIFDVRSGSWEIA